jgi:hypothetical protein
VALIGERPDPGAFGDPREGIDQLAPTVFFPSSGKEELGAKAAPDFHPETRAARKAVSGFFILRTAQN